MVLHLINDTIKGGVVEDGKLLLTNNWEMVRKTGTHESLHLQYQEVPPL